MESNTIRESIRDHLLHLRAAWLGCIVSPVPAMALSNSHDGRSIALWCFCAGCFSLVAYSFRQPIVSEQPVCPWPHRMLAVGLALFTAWVVFSLLWMALVDLHDFVALFVGFQILIPSFCIVPYMTLLTRKPFAAVVFSAFLLGCAKMFAGVVVNLVYGWGDGHHELPWTARNLMLPSFSAAG